jgi:hypothetical protein
MEESRTPMLWGRDRDPALRAFYTELIACPMTADVADSHQTLLRADDRLLAFRRSQWIVAINRTDHATTVQIDAAKGPAIAVRSSHGVVVREGVITLPALEGAIVRA